MEMDGCYITIESFNSEGRKQEAISFYEKTLYGRVCCGDIDISDEEIWEIDNPYFLSDVFVFCKKHLNVFTIGEVDMVCFIKVNHSNQIEEIGTDFEKRFHSNDINDILKRDDIRYANDLHKIMFSIISDEFWCGKYIQDASRLSRHS